MPKKKKKSNVPQEYGLIRFLAALMKEVGLPGFIVVMVFFVFLVWGSADQKSVFIDRFVLLKNLDQNPFPCVIIIITLLLIMLVTSIYWAKMLNLRKEENNRIGQEKSALQEKLLKRELESSN